MIEMLASAEKLPASTLARKRLLTEAEARGIFMAKGNGDAQVSKAQHASPLLRSTVSSITVPRKSRVRLTSAGNVGTAISKAHHFHVTPNAPPRSTISDDGTHPISLHGRGPGRG